MLTILGGFWPWFGGDCTGLIFTGAFPSEREGPFSQTLTGPCPVGCLGHSHSDRCEVRLTVLSAYIPPVTSAIEHLPDLGATFMSSLEKYLFKPLARLLNGLFVGF